MIPFEGEADDTFRLNTPHSSKSLECESSATPKIAVQFHVTLLDNHLNDSTT